MPRRPLRSEAMPPCYAMTVPGLETVAEAEITEALGGQVKKTATGLIVFRPALLDRSVLELRTVEDVFLLLWGTDELTYRAKDLDSITRWTSQVANWPGLLQLHHSIRPKPKGKPTYRLVTQMRGEHGYRRVDAHKALVRGLAGKLPARWRPAEEDAAVEIWLTIQGASAVCGLRLSDKTMRHRTYKQEHMPASLRPVVAAAMVRLSEPERNQLLLDPMCGAATILAERLLIDLDAPMLGGDIESLALRTAYANLRRFGQPTLACWDARRLPLRDRSVHRIVCNPPFGKQLGQPEQIGVLYQQIVREMDRVLKPTGRAVLLVSEAQALEQAAGACDWQRKQRLRLRVLGQQAFLYVWEKA